LKKAKRIWHPYQAQLALTLIESALAAGVAVKAIVADAFYDDHIGLARAEPAHSFKDAAQDTSLREWHAITRQILDGHRERCWATELMLFGYDPNKPVRAICATTDRRSLPEKATWYLTTNLTSEQAPLAEVVRLYGLRIWVEESYKRMKDGLGWADFMVRSDRAIRRHWTLVCCAFAFR
jgi:SRSO17 transposase